MRKANRARTLLVAALGVAAIGVAASGPFAGADPGGPPVNSGHQPFVISGDLSGALAPGSPSSPLDLTMTNPNNQQIAVAGLTVTVLGTSAGSSCDASNFGVVQYGGAYPLQLGARQTVSLTQLGVTATALPHVRMIDKPSNQDGCKHVTVHLSYTGTGQGK
jgi:hypothetical protein